MGNMIDPLYDSKSYYGRQPLHPTGMIFPRREGAESWLDRVSGP